MKPIVNLPALQQAVRPAKLAVRPVASVKQAAPSAKEPPLLEARPSPAAAEKRASTALAADAYRATGDLDALLAAPRFNVLL
ncbi:MAG: hypothetical protein RIC52_17965 [Amphiplicatus sp.]